MTQHSMETNEDCKLDAKEREWLHTANKYIDSKFLPLAGKLLKLFDETSTLIGRGILLALMFGGMAGLLWWVAVKLLK